LLHKSLFVTLVSLRQIERLFVGVEWQKEWEFAKKWRGGAHTLRRKLSTCWESEKDMVLCVCVCVIEGETECVCVWDRETDRAIEFVCLSKCVCEREWERERGANV